MLGQSTVCSETHRFQGVDVGKRIAQQQHRCISTSSPRRTSNIHGSHAHIQRLIVVLGTIEPEHVHQITLRAKISGLGRCHQCPRSGQFDSRAKQQGHLLSHPHHGRWGPMGVGSQIGVRAIRAGHQRCADIQHDDARIIEPRAKIAPRWILNDLAASPPTSIEHARFNLRLDRRWKKHQFNSTITQLIAE